MGGRGLLRVDGEAAADLVGQGLQTLGLVGGGGGEGAADDLDLLERQVGGGGIARRVALGQVVELVEGDLQAAIVLELDDDGAGGQVAQPLCAGAEDGDEDAEERERGSVDDPEEPSQEDAAHGGL